MSGEARQDAGHAALHDVLPERGVVVLSGAGMSTGSGIPDYRGPHGSLRHHTPMTYLQFTSGVPARQRYWARSQVGWPVMDRAEPNAGHLAVAALQRHGVVGTVITQNVDSLHRRAGSDPVVDLHGALSRVRCLDCGDRSDRRELSDRLVRANPAVAQWSAAGVNPDGDVDLPAELQDGFVVEPCVRCGGVLKPDVVFFGESVPPQRVRQCFDLVDAASAVLVLGSSLTVASGLRFVVHAHRAGTPVVIVNQGPTRGDEFAELVVSGDLSQVLTGLVRLRTNGLRRVAPTR